MFEAETINALPWTENDGGREAAGFGGSAGDCAVRAICIALGQDYEETYTEILTRTNASPSNGVDNHVLRVYLAERGWKFHYTGRQKFSPARIPAQHSRIIVSLHRHAVAVIDGVIHDTYASAGQGYRRMYGYFAPAHEIDALKEDPKAKRGRITRKVRGLLARTIENGATESEAAVALALANRLMTDYALTFKDINDVRDDVYVEAATCIMTTKSHYARRTNHPVRACLHALGRFAVCEHWFTGTDVVFFGTKADTELAIQLVALYRLQFDRDLADYQRSPQAKMTGEAPATRRANYAAAWTSARNRRLDKLTNERKAPPPAPVRYTPGTEIAAPVAEQEARAEQGRALVIAREQVLKEKYESHTAAFTWSRPRRSTRRFSSTNPITGAAARAAEARGDLGVGKKLQ